MDDVSDLLMGQAQRNAQPLLTVLTDAAAQAQQQGGDPAAHGGNGEQLDMLDKYGAMAGMFMGAATVLIWHQFNWFGLYEIVPGFLFAAIAIYVVSLLTEAPDNEICETFDKVEAEVRAG